MKRRSPLLAALAAAVAAAGACDKQPAGPVVDVSSQNTGTVRVSVFRDISSTATRNFVPGTGVRVSLFLPGDTLPLRQVTADTVGTELPNDVAQAVFTGLAPGQYIVRLSTRPLSEMIGAAADTVTVGPNGSVLSDTLRVRLGARVTGALAAEFTTAQGFTRTRFPGVAVQILRETGTNTNVFIPLTTVTTDATGSFDVPVTPGAGRFRFVFDAATITDFPNDTLMFGGTGTTVTPRGTVTATTTATSTAPDANVFQNLLYSFPSRITGSVFRDANTNGVFDAGEGLIPGDTVFVVLRDVTGARTLATATSTATSTSLTSATSVRVTGPATGNAAATYTLRSVAGGTYQVAIDRTTSKLAGASMANVRFDPVTVTVTNSLSTATVNIPLQIAP